ncbi:MAG: hypothetical protein M3413_09280 [Bacteroidota bacterium]|nr:hypothetical protein [Flavisolibacter sp.]MDQ3551707.1 hypothetical protein [Bacteroidota bacterium]
MTITTANAQIDSIRVIEPDKETSFENYELLIIAIAGFLILLGVYFFFKRSRR